MSEMLVDLLIAEMDWTKDKLERRLDGLTDDEFFWEPVPNCWTVRPSEEAAAGNMNGKGRWVYDYTLPDPDPPPFTTIAWRLVHIASINDMYHEHVFGARERDYEDQVVPHTAGAAVAWWRECFDLYRQSLAARTDKDLAKEIGPVPWGPTMSVKEWSQTLVRENIHHGAEIGCMRDLYRARSAAG
jgi:DinB superfamily